MWGGGVGGRHRLLMLMGDYLVEHTDKQTFAGLKFVPYRVIDTAAAQLTKTAIAVTAIFIVTMGYDNFYYVLGYTGVLNYKMNPVQNIGTGTVFLHLETKNWNTLE